MHFALIKVSDLILVNEDGEVVEGDEPINGAAFAIHSEIHKARPEVNAACHAHSVHGKAFSTFGRELDMITQDSLRFYKSHAVYAEFGGVVLDREEGRRITAALGNGKAVILQNHGLLTVSCNIGSCLSGLVLMYVIRLAEVLTRRRFGLSVWIKLAMRSFLLMQLSWVVVIRGRLSMKRKPSLHQSKLGVRRKGGWRSSLTMMRLLQKLMVGFYCDGRPHYESVQMKSSSWHLSHCTGKANKLIISFMRTSDHVVS